jgi:hypothetical protein
MILEVDAQQLVGHEQATLAASALCSAEVGADTVPHRFGSMQTSSELERALHDAGGADAPPEWSARLRDLLRAELGRGSAELDEARTGRERPIVLAIAPADGSILAVLPVAPELRADPGAVSDRGAALAAAAVGALVEAVGPGPPRRADDLSLRLGAHEGFLAMRVPASDSRWAAEYAREALHDAAKGIDRLRARALLLPGHALEPTDERAPIGATHPLRVAEAVAALGGSPLDDESIGALEPQLLALLEPEGSVARAHDDPDPRCRVMRRILQRLDGMGKWGGYHTAFDHLARGFAGNERAFAYEMGEELLAAGLLTQKPSVGQRHVNLNSRRAGEIRRLIDAGELPPGL